MSDLFIRLYLDEDVSVVLAPMLRARGFDALTTGEAGNRAGRDDEQLAFATQSGRSIVTHNRVDLEKLAADYLASGQSHHGIFSAVLRPPREILLRLLKILDDVTAAEMKDQVR